MYELKKIKEATYLIPKFGNMRVDGLIIATDKMIKREEIQRPIEQLINVAALPGIVGYSIAMPDIHWGYGFPIGGVAAMDMEDGVISPGGVGYDINCGVRFATLPLSYEELSSKKEELLKEIYRSIPSGVGSERKKEKELSSEDYRSVCQDGARWALEHGYGFENDLAHSESLGVIEGGDISFISKNARDRGKKQLGSLGSGNHFVEIGKIERIDDRGIADEWGVREDGAYILVHTGSRGFGHQICQDTLNDFVKKGYAEGLPDRQLVAAPINSEDGRRYLQNMAAAANFAFNNRQIILHLIRENFYRIYGIKREDIKQLYDVCHNMAKIEEHEVDGKLKKLCVHRKGATRAFGPGNRELAPIFQKSGQPVLVPGDMGRASYLLVGRGNKLTWQSSCHGAGRAMSRAQSYKRWKRRDLIGYMKDAGVDVMARSNATIAEEMPDAYKDIDEVVAAVADAELAKIVAKLKPHLVIKG